MEWAVLQAEAPLRGEVVHREEALHKEVVTSGHEVLSKDREEVSEAGVLREVHQEVVLSRVGSEVPAVAPEAASALHEAEEVRQEVEPAVEVETK